MVLESVISNVSPPRPNSLCLKNSWNNLQDHVNNENIKMTIGQDQQSSVMRRKKKRRAAGSGVRKFNQIYEPTGENLGSGSQGCVSTYKNATTGIEYAVKVSSSYYQSADAVLLHTLCVPLPTCSLCCVFVWLPSLWWYVVVMLLSVFDVFAWYDSMWYSIELNFRYVYAL